MPYVAPHDADFMDEQYVAIKNNEDLNLCYMLQTMKLDGVPDDVTPSNGEDAQVARSDTIQQRPSSNLANLNHVEPPCGCAYLRAIHHQLQWGSYGTTGGEYLDAIFTHREILVSQPSAHTECARAFSDLAAMMEKRAWRSDREADQEAVAAFRHEAWVVALTLAPPARMKPTNSICLMVPSF